MPREDYEIVRNDNPKCEELEKAGYTLVATSWGAHLDTENNFDIENLKKRIANCESNGYKLEMLGAGYAQKILDLEILNNPYYPQTPATAHDMPTIETTRALFKPNSWTFGAFKNDELVGVCATSKRSDKTEIDFGSVHPEHRGYGVGIGVAAYAIFTLIELGEHKFGTGGAEVNSASRTTVQKLGFSVDEIWNTYRKPE